LERKAMALPSGDQTGNRSFRLSMAGVSDRAWEPSGFMIQICSECPVGDEV
jgi:hypothetical protein